MTRKRTKVSPWLQRATLVMWLSATVACVYAADTNGEWAVAFWAWASGAAGAHAARDLDGS